MPKNEIPDDSLWFSDLPTSYEMVAVLVRMDKLSSSDSIHEM